jgi:hypothetical protein
LAKKTSILPSEVGDHPLAKNREPLEKATRLGCQSAAVLSRTTLTGVHHGKSKRFLTILDAVPDVPITFTQEGGRFLDGPGLVYGPEDFTEAISKGVLGTGFQPNLDPRG